MGFFQDLKQDLSQAVSELVDDATLEKREEAVEIEKEAVSEVVEDIKVIEDIEVMEDIELTEDQVDSILAVQESDIDIAELDALLQIETPKEGGIPAFNVDAMLSELDELEEEITKEETAIEEKGMEELAETEKMKEVAAMAEPIVGQDSVTNTEIEEIKTIQNTGADKKMEAKYREVSDETAIITKGMKITGDVASEGSMEVVGEVAGNIDILGKLNVTGVIHGNSQAAEIYAESARITGEIVSEGSVKIGQSSVVIGNIMATSAVIAGAVKGDIDVQGPVVLDSSAIVMGNIKSKSVQINNGAVIEGLCSQCYADVSPSNFFNDLK